MSRPRPSVSTPTSPDGDGVVADGSTVVVVRLPGRSPEDERGPHVEVVEVLGHAGRGDPGGCGFGTPDGPCPNAPASSVAMAAAHPDDGVARWLLPAWTLVCSWHRDAVDDCLADETAIPDLWRARGGAAGEHPRVVDPARRGLARWLERTPDGIWAGELGL